MTKITYTANGKTRILAPDARPRSLLSWLWAALVAVGRWVWEW